MDNAAAPSRDEWIARAESLRPPGANAVLVLADGAVFWGRGIGREVGDIAFAGLGKNRAQHGAGTALADHRHRGVLQSVQDQHPRLAQALGAGGADEVLVEGLKHGGARDAGN